MRMIWRILPVLILFASCTGKNVSEEADSGTLDSYVVVVSFDGFRWDYQDLYETPNFDLL